LECTEVGGAQNFFQLSFYGCKLHCIELLMLLLAAKMTDEVKDEKDDSSPTLATTFLFRSNRFCAIGDAVKLSQRHRCHKNM
jgi:hypothetical protein